METCFESIPNAESDEDGAMRFADWARAQSGVTRVVRQGIKVLVRM